MDTQEPTPLDRLRAALVDSAGLDDIPEPEPLIGGVRAWESAAGMPMAGVQFLPVAVQATSDGQWAAFVELARELRPFLLVLDTPQRHRPR